ncbi:hypothetical protein SAMN06296058_0730 [Pseudoxanthomonas indica]|uniref:Response regulatory domain-containing protein n=1 Tax=Pseudoxanthomonas indica TaxID=428993 RepID=A0A1T5JDM2_9GAMM|nr:hypothetical protein GCM10007235_33090 [Pseudoxanthomonas indica]SKC49677.1 hypothetical protein SAMN06296058_0730 [Pseudoxanthomonas indica]
MQSLNSEFRDWVLVAESNYLIAEQLCSILQDWGFVALAAPDMKAAEDMMEKSLPIAALVCTHLNDGLCLALIRRLTRLKIPILILSGSTPEEADIELRSLPWCTKPCRTEDMRQALLNLLDPAVTPKATTGGCADRGDRLVSSPVVPTRFGS